MRKILLPFLSLTLAGCVPAPYGPYYRPSYPDPSSTLSKGYCGGQAGPETKLQFTGPEGLVVSVDAGKVHSDQDLSLAILIEIPAGSRFQFLADHMEVISGQDNGEEKLFPEAWISTSLTLPKDGWVDFEDSAPTSAEIALRHQAGKPEASLAKVTLASGELKGFAPGALDVELPSISGLSQTPAEASIQLEARDGAVGKVFRTREYQAMLEDRYRICQERTPAKSCSNILAYEPNGLRQQTEDLTLTGSFTNYGKGPTSIFRYELTAEARTTGRWRLSGTELRFRDRESGEARQAPLGNLPLSWHYAIPLSARIKAATAPQAVTRLRLQGSLGERELSRYQVKLPAFILNGTTHRLQPIELERRSLDGGLEPFNC